MTDTHVVSALQQKRIQLASEIEYHPERMRLAVIALDHVEASLRLFDPDVQMGELRFASMYSQLTSQVMPPGSHHTNDRYWRKADIGPVGAE